MITAYEVSKNPGAVQNTESAAVRMSPARYTPSVKPNKTGPPLLHGIDGGTFSVDRLEGEESKLLTGLLHQANALGYEQSACVAGTLERLKPSGVRGEVEPDSRFIPLQRLNKGDGKYSARSAAETRTPSASRSLMTNPE